MSRIGAVRSRRGKRRVDYFTAIKRILLFVAVWVCAILVGIRAIRVYQYHQAVAHQVSRLDTQYNGKLQDYASELAEGVRLEKSAEYQKDLLKKHFGYTEQNETPIIILPESEASK